MDLFEVEGEWEDTAPPEVRTAIKHLRERFDDGHWKYGTTTCVYCYCLLHNGESSLQIAADYGHALAYMRRMVGTAAIQQFDALVKENTPSHIFRAYFDLYLDAMTLQAAEAFSELTQIGLAHKSSLKMDYVEWAQLQTKHMIRCKRPMIRRWVRDVCDKQPPSAPGDDPDEIFFWRKWQAPLFLRMKPCLHFDFEAERVWERQDADLSGRLLTVYEQEYVIHLELALEKVAGSVAVDLAKQPMTPGENNGPSPTGASINKGEAASKPNTAALDPNKPETWTADYAWSKLHERTMSLKLQELTLQMLEKLTAKIGEIWVEGVRRQNPVYTRFERLKLEEETAEEFAQKRLDSAIELWEAQGYCRCHGIYHAIQVQLIFPFFEHRKQSVSRDLLKGLHSLPERNQIEAALRRFSGALVRRESRWRKRVEVLGREANLVLLANRKAEEKMAAAKLAEKTDLSQETKASTKPNRTTRRMSEGRRWRRQVIFGVLQLAAEGPEYCRELDKGGLNTPEAWQSDGCPAMYADAYKSQDFRRKIHDEKHYMKKKFASMTPAERERVINGTGSRTRK